MQVKLLSTFRWLRLDIEPGFHEMMPTVHFVTGAANIKKQLGGAFKAIAGDIEFNHFSHVDHLICDLPHEVSAWDGFDNGEPLLVSWLVYLDWLLQDSWLVKDNAITCEIAYCNLQLGGRSSWTNNGLFSTISTAEGYRHQLVEFNSVELAAWAKISLDLRVHLHEKGYSVMNAPSAKETTRFSRFLYFINASRRVAHPPLKISQVCSALESLFSTSTGELTHRLSERVAFFLGGSGGEMEARYQFMKKAYAIRSQVTHGSHISNALMEAAPAVSVGLLDICRQIVLAVLADQEKQSVVYGSNDDIENHFRKVLFN
ncbi:hypothetical protein PS683_03727 [Pseudomonas fluorescens]|uniref:Uncharacterized protein n=1 Tax=Pseudomonas fluorescens TaxID=294 RepID=A0A5E6UTI9_PSEFL|nr:hypothetical protein PS683_03727 [Pseudomonas fluorescens]VVN08683.1 hypothetical protein PS683_03727 [Pseudomonas fluorescens]